MILVAIIFWWLVIIIWSRWQQRKVERWFKSAVDLFQQAANESLPVNWIANIKKFEPDSIIIADPKRLVQYRVPIALSVRGVVIENPVLSGNYAVLELYHNSGSELVVHPGLSSIDIIMLSRYLNSYEVETREVIWSGPIFSVAQYRE